MIRMQIKLLKEISEEIGGKSGTDIVDLLYGKKDVNEFLIAKKLNMTINQIRNVLYKLSASGLVSFTRKKDKRKGWYIYFWTLNNLKSLELLERKLKEELGQLENQLKSRKTKRFYICDMCKIEVSEETALFHDFACQECGEVYTLSESGDMIKEVGNKLIKLKKSLEFIAEENGKILEKNQKTIKRRDVREKKEKTEKRRKARKEREKEKAKEEGVKKKVKKKPVKKKKAGKKKAKKAVKKKSVKKKEEEKKAVKKKSPKKKSKKK